MDNNNQPSRTSSAGSRSRGGSASSSRRGESQPIGPDGLPQLRPTSANSPVMRGVVLQEVDVASDAGSNTTLPPINDSVPNMITPTDTVDSNILANTMAGEKNRGHQYPRVLGFKREMAVDEDSVVSLASMASSDKEKNMAQMKNVSFSRPQTGQSSSPTSRATTEVSISHTEYLLVSGHDGQDMTLISTNCQTEWSWLQDMQLMQRMGVGPGGSGARSMGPALSSTGYRMSTAEESPEERDKSSTRLDSRKSDRMRNTSRAFSEMSKFTLKGQDTATVITEASDVTIPPPFAADDTYGIPIMMVSSSDSEMSDDEDSGRPPADPHATLPSIGPPQILQYNRESGQHVEDPSMLMIDENGEPVSSSATPPMTGGIFEGVCEFCGVNIRPFPTLEEQKDKPPEELYCCEDYRQFVNFMLSHPLHEKFNVDKLIDIAPHPPHGSKQARRAAKERAAQRMRERELARQQAAMAGMNTGMGGGMGGGAGPSNFYQFARQMKTINYQLSSQKCLEEGWTVRPPSPVEDMGDDIEVFEPQPKMPHWATKDSKDSGLVFKYYDDKSPFMILFPDGTGTVYYMSGRTAIHILSVSDGLYSYIIYDDTPESNMLGAFDPDGHGASYYQHGVIRVCLDPYGGIELDPRGFKKRRWSWKDQVQHVHAPPIQPITFALSSHLALRIMSQDQISLTFKTRQRSCRFQIGATLKVVAPENVPPIEVDEDQWFRQEVENRIQDMFAKVSNLLKFPKSPKVAAIASPHFINSRVSRMERDRDIATARASSRLEKQKTALVFG